MKLNIAHFTQLIVLLASKADRFAPGRSSH